MGALDFLVGELAQLRADDLLREDEGGLPSTVTYLNASSNDYLGLAQEVVSRETNLAASLGAGASALIYGRRREHVELERELADWVNTEEALVFSSGYAANVGTISALARAGDVVISDQLNHASLIDGCRLSRAEVRVVPHCDLSAVAQVLGDCGSRRAWVVTESYFSMDGDCPDLRGLRQLCDAHGAALYVDEAHALGVVGPQGAGVCRQLGVVPDVLVGTLGKAVGVQGAFVAGSRQLQRWLWNKARSFVFSTAISPLLATLVRANVQRARSADAERARIATAAIQLAATLREQGLTIPAGARGHIIPVMLGDSGRALAAARRLREAGILVQAIRPPTVPRGTARLRLTVNAAMSASELRYLTVELLSTLRSTLPVPASVDSGPRVST